MSTPTEQFASLSLDPHNTSMTPTKDAKRSAVLGRDALSSLDPKLLPSEFETSTFNNIMERIRSSPGRPPKTYWTISFNLYRTLLQWNAYDDRIFSAVMEFQTPFARARSFAQKLQRRFKECIEEYDALPNSSSPDTVRDDFGRIVRNLGVLSSEISEDRRQLCIYEDWQDRVSREKLILEVVLEVLELLCQRTEAKVQVETVRRSSRRNPSLGESNTSLFAAVVRQTGFGSAADRTFVLDGLELCSGAALRQCLQKLIYVNGLLNDKSAGADYIRRFESLQEKAREDEEKVEALPGPSGSRVGNTRNREADDDSKTGSKRPQQHQPAEATTKRGRRGNSS